MIRAGSTSLVWVVCGAGSGVGKTTLALRLCEVLPGSTYAKCGRGRAKTHKPPHFFHTLAALGCFVARARRTRKHLVVESSAWARQGRGDVTIFIDAPTGHTCVREDVEALRSAADLHVSRTATPKQWQAALKRMPIGESLRSAVVDALAEQKRRLFGAYPVVRSKVWFEAGGRRAFGAGIACLLENVARLGTLTAAAQAAGMSYRYAWKLLRNAETHLGRPLIARRVGGRHGGGSALTADGRRWLSVFSQLNDNVAAFADDRFRRLCTHCGTNG